MFLHSWNQSRIPSESLQSLKVLLNKSSLLLLSFILLGSSLFADPWAEAEKEFYEGNLEQAYQLLLPIAKEGDEDARLFSSLFLILTDDLDDLDELDGDTRGFDLLLQGRWIEFEGDIGGAIALYEKAAALKLKQAQQKLDMLRRGSLETQTAKSDPKKKRVFRIPKGLANLFKRKPKSSSTSSTTAPELAENASSAPSESDLNKSDSNTSASADQDTQDSSVIPSPQADEPIGEETKPQKKSSGFTKGLASLFKRKPKDSSTSSEGEAPQLVKSEVSDSELDKTNDSTDSTPAQSASDKNSENDTGNALSGATTKKSRFRLPSGLARLFNPASKSKADAKLWAKAEKEFYDGDLTKAYETLLPLAKKGDEDAQTFASLYHILMDNLDDLDDLQGDTVGFDLLLKGRWKEFLGDIDGAISAYEKSAGLGLKQAQQKLDMLRKSSGERLSLNSPKTETENTQAKSSFGSGLANLFKRKPKSPQESTPEEEDIISKASEKNVTDTSSNDSTSQEPTTQVKKSNFGFGLANLFKRKPMSSQTSDSAATTSESKGGSQETPSSEPSVEEDSADQSDTLQSAKTQSHDNMASSTIPPKTQKSARNSSRSSGGFASLFGFGKKSKSKASAELWAKAEKEFYDGNLHQAYQTLLPLAEQGDQDAQTFASLYHILLDQLDDLDELEGDTVGFEELLKGRWLEFKGDLDGAISLYEKSANLGLKQAQQKLDQLRKASASSSTKITKAPAPKPAPEPEDPKRDEDSSTSQKPSAENVPPSSPVHETSIHGVHLGMGRDQILNLLKEKGINPEWNKETRKGFSRLFSKAQPKTLLINSALDGNSSVSSIEVDFENERIKEVRVEYKGLSLEESIRISSELHRAMADVLHELQITRNDDDPKNVSTNILAIWKYRVLEKH